MVANLEFPYKIRLSVHGLIPLTSQERAIQDTTVFQRLRRITQLGMTSLVYPSATHSRFEHSLGTMHAAWRISRNLQLPASEQRIIRLAGMLHDVGHGPFSHISENVIDDLTGLPKTHEYYGGATILHHPEIKELIDEKDRDAICQLIVPIQTSDRKFPFQISYLRNRTLAKDIISGPTDADKMDYLLRDSHHCFVKYGEFDLQKILDSPVSIHSAGVEQLGFEEDAVWALEQMLLARHHMHRQVYGHPTRLGTDAMLIRSLREAIDGGEVPEADFNWNRWTEESAQAFLEAYLLWDDERLLMRLAEIEGPPGVIANRLLRRNLLKAAFRMELQDLVRRNEIPEHFIGQLLDESLFTRDRIALIEEHIADGIEQDPHMVIFTLESVKNPTYRPPAYRMEQEWLPEDIMLRTETGENIAFANVSEIFGGAREVERNYLTVYCDLPAQKEKRDMIRETVKDTLIEQLQYFYEELN